MFKLIFGLCCLFFLTSFAAAQKKEGYSDFLKKATEDFMKSAEKTNKDFKIGTYDRWDADQETGELIFSNKGVKKVIAKVQIAGSYSRVSNTWKWSWANDTVYDSMKKDMRAVKEYGEKNIFLELTTPIFECLEDYAWTMTAAAGYLTKAKGGYRGPNNDGYVYFLIMDINWAEDKK